MDQHVPEAVTHGLRLRSADVLTVFEDGRAKTPDEELLHRATELGRIIFTQDDDFLALADKWNANDKHFTGIVYSHQLNATIGQLVDDLQLIIEAMSLEEIRDRVIFLPL